MSHYISQHNHHYNASCLSATLHKGHEEFAYNVYIMLHLKPVISITYSDTLLIHAGMCKPGVLLTLTLGSILHMLSICMAHMLLQMVFQTANTGYIHQTKTEWLLGVQLRHFSTTCAVHIEDCEGWWLSGCRSSVAEHWLHKPGVLGSIPGDCWPFHFPLFSPHNI